MGGLYFQITDQGLYRKLARQKLTLMDLCCYLCVKDIWLCGSVLEVAGWGDGFLPLSPTPQAHLAKAHNTGFFFFFLVSEGTFPVKVISVVGFRP
jgi:hypothetical protein